MFKAPEKFRIQNGPFRTTEADGNNGLFEWGTLNGRIRVICSDGGGWEHVSVSFEKRCPTWGEMCMVKDLFWSEEDCVIQYHPPKKDYVNYAPFCLHLWKPVGIPFPMPPTWMVGPKG